MPRKIQKTIGGKIKLAGIGLHTGEKCLLNIKPAKENRGITFRRIDLKNSPTVPANINYVIDTHRGTTLECNDVRIHTVEHLLAALAGLGVNNAIIEMTGPEPPIMDGSAIPFVQAIENTGLINQDADCEIFSIVEPVQIKEPGSDVELNFLPSKQYKITFFMDYGLPNFGMQYTATEDAEADFAAEIAPARTFGLLSEVAQLKENGLIKGGSLENAVIIVDKKVNKEEQSNLSKLFGLNTEIGFNNNEILNGEKLRYDNEPVRHKVLDLMGDMALLGKPIHGHIIATKSGHSTNIELVKILKQKIKT